MSNKMFSNHRQNVRDRFMTSSDSLRDYELLEMLLFLAIPRRDTRTIAKILMNKFGSLEDVMNADRDQLMGTDGIGINTVSTLHLFHEVLMRMMRDDIKKSKSINLDKLKSVKKYCRVRIGHLVHEEVLALFLNGSMKLVAEDIINTGNYSETKLYKNILITKATQNGATGIILAHNHPSGDPKPSEADIITTGNLRNILGEVGIELLDHLIVTHSKVFSFLAAGLLLR
jgi:DNA repair protein RadC